MPCVSLYAAYGSNMDPEQMRARCPHSPLAGVAWLPGHRLTFGGEDLGWEGALATVVPDPAGRVFVALYELSAGDEAALDQWEGADTGLYVKLHVRVSPATPDGDPEDAGQLAWLYALDGYEGGLPSARYLGVMADAAEAAGAPGAYVAALRSRECRSLGE